MSQKNDGCGCGCGCSDGDATQDLQNEKQEDTQCKHTEQSNTNASDDSEKDDNSITLKRKEYESLLSKCKEAEEKLIYAYADFDNYKKRQQKYLSDQIKFSNEAIIKELLPIVDNFKLANLHACNCNDDGSVQIEKFIEGVDLISKQILDVFARYGVQEIDAMGKVFDPQFHEAMDQRNSKDFEEGCIIEEYQKGYTMHGRLLRSAKVSICKKNQEKNEGGN